MVTDYEQWPLMGVRPTLEVTCGSGYIFDVEGTLVDCVREDLLSLQETLADFGVTVPYDVLQLYSGLDGDQALQLVAPDLDAGERKRVMEAQSKLYEARYLRNVKAFTAYATCSRR
jgi:phosphoglycolate phosphatase-like HAD superfamily hydrolase